jgi:hypothetical protein
VSRALSRLARTAGIAAALFTLDGCQAALEAPHTAATPLATAPVATAPAVTPPPVVTGTALPAVTPPPLGPPPSVNPAQLGGGSASSAGSGRGTRHGPASAHPGTAPGH